MSLIGEQHLVCAGRLWKSSLSPLDLCLRGSVGDVFIDTERFLEAAVSKMPTNGSKRRAMKSCE